MLRFTQKDSGLKRREVIRLTVVWSLLVATVALLLVVLWPSEKVDQDTQASPGLVTKTERAGGAGGWSVFALVRGSAMAVEQRPETQADQREALVLGKQASAGLPAWAWGVDVRNPADLYERWAGFAATQGGDHFAVDSLVELLRGMGWRAAEGMVEVAIERKDWRVTSAMFASGFIGIEDVERQEMVRRIVHGPGCVSAPECAYMAALNEISPETLKAIYAKVRIDREACGPVLGVEGMKAAVRSLGDASGSLKGPEWCGQVPDEG